MAKGTTAQATAQTMTGSYALQGDHQAADAPSSAAVWPGELDEQLISELLSDDSLLGALQLPNGDSDHHCSGDTTGLAPAPCTSGGDLAAEPQPALENRPLCSVYSGPTIEDIEKALSSRPINWSNRRYSPMYFGRFGAASSRAQESKYTTKVRSCGGNKTPSDGFKWRKYGQKSIKNNPYPRSYYKCTSSRCGAKKHVEKCVDDPEMLVVTYEGPHLHGPQPPFPRRQWASSDLFFSAVEARGAGGGVVVAGEPPGRQNGRALENVVSVTATRSCDGGWGASVAAPRDGTALPCESPPTTWSCPDFYYSSWSPEVCFRSWQLD